MTRGVESTAIWRCHGEKLTHGTKPGISNSPVTIGSYQKLEWVSCREPGVRTEYA
jgi:hypothetical protein